MEDTEGMWGGKQMGHGGGHTEGTTLWWGQKGTQRGRGGTGGTWGGHRGDMGDTEGTLEWGQWWHKWGMTTGGAQSSLGGAPSEAPWAALEWG